MRYVRYMVLSALLLAVGLMPVQARQDAVTVTLSVPQFFQDQLTDSIAQFEANNPGIKVYVNPTDNFGGGGGGGSDPANGVAAHLTSVLNFVQSADVLFVSNSDLTPQATRAGYYLDLSPLTSSDASLNPSDFYPAVWQSVQWDGGVWALPVSTDVTVITYDPTAFDTAGIAYPNGNWTMDDFANAAKALTQHDSSGKVTVPGMAASGTGLAALVRALAGTSLLDETVVPNVPNFSSNTAIAGMLDTWKQLQADGDVSAGFGDTYNSIPLRIEGSFGLFRAPGDNSAPRGLALLPGNTAALNVQAFAVSAGTLYPEQAYALAAFLSSDPAVATNVNGVRPARQSLVGVEPPSSGSNSGPGGGAVIRRVLRGNYSADQEAMFDQGIANGIPMSEMRYMDYLGVALTAVVAGTDSSTALQQAEAQAIADGQTADAAKGAATIAVATPPPPVALAPGKITLNFGYASFTRRFPNQQGWDQVISDFTANDPQVGAVNITTDPQQAANFGATQDCYYLPYNAVPDLDLSTALSLDPYMDADPAFDRNDFVGNILTQVQRNNQTWAYPLSIQPEVLRYSDTMFQQAGLNNPPAGWTVDDFNSDLKLLKPTADDPTPFQSLSPGDTYLLMLIASYGGLPIDFRTSPATINYTDATTQAAIQQVLDLAKNGYLKYQALGGGFAIRFGGADQAATAMYSENLGGGFNFGPQGNQGGSSTAYGMTTFPIGNQYTPISYSIGTAYISATSQNPDACYRFISTLAQHTELFSDMPVRRSMLNNSTLAASQGPDAVAFFNAIDAMMQDQNTVIIPTPTGGRSITGFLTRYWLDKAFDDYVTNGADLGAGLADAQTKGQGYEQCLTTIDPSLTGNDYLKAVGQCAVTVDSSLQPLFTAVFGG